VDASPPEYGGRFVEASIGDASNLIYPLSSDSASHEIANLLYVAPLKYDKDLKIVPWAAESFEARDSGKILRFTLKRGIKWEDGRELTTADVEFTYKLMIDPKTPTAYAEDFKQVKEFKVLDAYTFEVIYDKPFARSLATWMSGILPKHVLEKEDLLNTKFSRKPIGAGSHKLKEWTAGQQITLTARDDYFEGRPYIDEIVYRIIPDLSTMFLELKAGNLDMMGLTPQQYLYQTKGPEWDKPFHKYKYLAFSYTYLGYNLSNPMFSDVRVRRALAHAINKKEIIKGVLLDMGVPTIGPYKPGTWAYNEQIADYEYDTTKAKQLMAEAGWEMKDGVMQKDKKPFTFTILTNQGNELRIKTATIIQNRLKEIGVDVKIRTVEWASFIKEFVDKRRFDAIILGWSIPQDPDVYDIWHSSKIANGGLNHIGYKNPEVDALLEQGRRTLDQGKRKEIYDRLQEILHQDQPYCFLYAPYALPIIQSRVRGVEPAPSGINHNFIKWWIPKGMQKAERTK
jgi:peptide/nickel transport system substrate-binding protein